MSASGAWYGYVMALRVGFILARRFTLSAFSTFVDVLRLAGDEGDRSRPIECAWRVLSASMDPIQSSCGVMVQPEERPGNPRRFDYVVVVGGLVNETERLDPALTAFLKQAAEAGVPLVGLCTGAFILHGAGLMRGYRACVSWFHREDFLERFEGLEPVADQIFVVDRDRLTCAGGVSAAHLAAYLVGRHLGDSRAAKALRIMMIDEALPADVPQPGMPLQLQTDDPLVRRALLAMQQGMDAPLPLGRLAQRMGVGRRTLERRFLGALGMSPGAADRLVRLEQARHLLRATERSVTRIAAETGFCDASHLIRVFREVEGTTPEAWRERA